MNHTLPTPGNLPTTSNIMMNSMLQSDDFKTKLISAARHIRTTSPESIAKIQSILETKPIPRGKRWFLYLMVVG